MRSSISRSEVAVARSRGLWRRQAYRNAAMSAVLGSSARRLTGAGSPSWVTCAVISATSVGPSKSVLPVRISYARQPKL
ncbi:hypothetical protein BE08_25830 [Sorangium cellulosum]|uniref:Uncharacterized protein n=1 Tax=Sorangium cellulosum TaxID=56 RepID=A0A150P6U1_SORCE|nr:hypothetical protein BE08_25830 [Sorangium cellulosum]